MAIGSFDKTENTEKNVEQENPEKQDFKEADEKQSLGDKLKEGLSKLFHKKEGSEVEEDSEVKEEPKTKEGKETSEGEDSKEDNDSKETSSENPNSNEARKAMREKMLEEYDNKLFDTVKKHGEMLDRRTDLPQDEKNEMQTEVTENYKKAVAEYKDWLENESEYKDVPEDR